MARKNRHVLHLCIGAVILAISLAACSSSKTSTSVKTTAETGSTKSTILLGGAAPLTAQILQQPDVKAGLEAAISAVNAGGGVNGHPLKLDFCDTLYTTNQELACMRKFIAEKVSAVISPEILADQTGAAYKLAEAASLPVIGTLGLSPAEFTSPVVFPLSSGIPGWTYGSIAALVGNGCRKIGLLGTNEGASVFQVNLAVAALELAGLAPVNKVSANLESDPTFAVSAAKATSGGVCGMLVVSNPVDLPKAVQAVKGAGFTGKISSETAIFTPAIIKALGSAADGIELTAQVALVSDTANPAVASFLADMKKYQPSQLPDEQSEVSWASIHLYAKLMASATDFSSASVLAALNNLSTPIDLGLTGPFAVKGVTPILTDFPRIFNPTIANGSIKNGIIEPDGKGLVNPFELLKNAAK